MPLGPTKRTLWTVAQVATWIRYRDVERLTDREQPFERTAREEIRAALKDGNLTAYANGKKIARVFWESAALLYRGREARTLRRGYTQVRLDMQDCKRAWPQPADVLNNEPVALRVLLDRLGEEQRQEIASPVARWFLTLPRVMVTGLNSSGRRIEIDAQALINGKIGRHNDAIVGGHGQLSWHVVTVELRLLLGRNAPLPPVPPKGRVANDEVIKAWMVEYQQELKQMGLKHGRDVVLKAAMEQFGVSRKVVLLIWSSGSSQRGPGRPKAA